MPSVQWAPTPTRPTTTASRPAAPPIDFSQAQFQQPNPAPPIQPAPAAPPQVSAPGPVAAPTGVTTNTAQSSPELMDYLARVKARLDNGGDDTRALNQAGQAISQFAEGARNVTRGDFSRRGVGGAGSEQGAMDDIGNVAQQSFGRAAEGIAIARNNANDAVLMGSQGAFAEPGRQALADRGLGVQQRGQDLSAQLQGQGQSLQAQIANAQLAQQATAQAQQQQIEAARLAQQQQLAMLSAWSNLYR